MHTFDRFDFIIPENEHEHENKLLILLHVLIHV